ncbi:MAG: hypothetical protein ACRDZ3_03205 [Acidimicrobiia bacterium]
MARRRLALAIGLGALWAAGLPVRAAAPSPEIDHAESLGYLRSTDSGVNFVPADLDDQGLGVGIASVDAAGGRVHVAFSDNNQYDDEYKPPVGPIGLYYRRSDASGGSFGPSVRLDDDGGDSTEADLVADGSNVVVAWEEAIIEADNEDIMIVRSQDGGGTFSAAENLTGTKNIQERDPVLAADGTLVALGYEAADEKIDTGAGPDSTTTDEDDILLRVSGDGGATFDAPDNLTFVGVEGIGATADEQRHDEPSISVSGDTVAVAFRIRPPDERNHPDVGGDRPARIGFVRTTDRGATYSPITVLPSDVDVGTTPAVLLRDGIVHLVACHEADPAVAGDSTQLLYWRSADGGASFPAPQVLHTSAEPCNKPVIDGVGSVIDVAFEQDVHGAADVFFLTSADGGATFGAARDMTSNFESSSDPALAVDPTDAAVHLTWRDRTSFLFSLEQPQELIVGGSPRVIDGDDVVRSVAGIYEIAFDGEDVGLAGFVIDALATTGPAEPGAMPGIVLSFTEPGSIAGAGDVDDADLVLFTPTRLGEDTEGTFSLYFDGTVLGLDDDGEDIDAVEIDAGQLYLSTAGAFALADGLTGDGVDVFVCSGVEVGGTSACRSTETAWSGSAAGFSGDEDLDGLAFNPDGNLPGETVLFTAAGAYDTGTAAGGGSDLISCAIPEADEEVPGSKDGSLTDCGSAAAPLLMSFPAAAHGLTSNIAALDLEF